MSTRRAPVLFVPEIARGLIGHFVAAIRGSSQYRQSSFLLNSVGQQVFPAGFSIAERPHIPKAMGSAPFDDEGVATRDRELIVDGVLTGYILSSYSARKLGLQTTGNAGGAHNLLVAPTLAGGMDAMLARLGTGLLVTELMGQGVNMVTGDYSRGAAGFWVENGADSVSGGGNHHRRQFAQHAQGHRRGGRRRRRARRHARGLDLAAGNDHRRRMTRPAELNGLSWRSNP